jgi:Mg2+ and Co2+ transporter CorA
VAEPRQLFPPEKDPRKDLREAVDSVLSDRFMIFISAMMIPIVLIPFIINLSSQILDFFEICDWVIISIFVVEYFSKLYLASDRGAYFSSGWHLLDLVIIILAFVQYAPLFGIGISGSPSLLLRLLRLPRAVAVGGRTLGGRRHGEEIVMKMEEEVGETVIREVGGDLSTVHENLTWDEMRQYTHDPKQEWIDIYNASDSSFMKISEILKIPEPYFESRLIEDGYPHIDYLDRASLIFLQSGRIKYPEHEEHFLTISRTGVLIICSGSEIITVSKRRTNLFEKVLEAIRKGEGNKTLVVSVLYGIMEQLLSDYRSIVNEIEMDILKIEAIPRSKLPKDILERTFQLNKEVSRLGSGTLHFKEVLGMIVTKRVDLEGFDKDAEESFEVLQDESDYLNDTIQNLKDNLLSIIDLYINRTSYETNKILKILAVITAVGVIPAIISGLLGENLLDIPFTVYLWQIVLLTGIGMALVIYVFIKLGWLKT